MLNNTFNLPLHTIKRATNLLRTIAMAAMVPSHPKLVWPRSDGKPERWPVHSSANNSGWFERVKP